MTLYDKLMSYETDPSNEPDARRVISNERQALFVALERVAAARATVKRVPSEANKRALLAASERLSDVETEARRVAAMWGAL